MKRNYGIDALRMVAMGFVIVLHLTGTGGICTGAEYLSFNYFFAQFVRISTYCAVNCYALISGYVGWSREPKISSILSLWFKVVCFCLGVTLATAIFSPESVSWKNFMKAVMPLCSKQYWYFSSYAGLFLLMPLLNYGIRSMPQRTAARMLILACFCVYPLSILDDPFQLQQGYSTLWLSILYLAGAYFGKYGTLQRLSRKQWAAGYLLAALGAYLPRMLVLILLQDHWIPSGYNLMVKYTSPTVILAAVTLLGLFSQLELSNSAIRVVSKLSPHAFGVYLLHTHPLIFHSHIEEQLVALGTLSAPRLLGILLLATVGIYAAGTAADWAITKSIQLTRIDKLLKKLDRFTQ